MHRFAAKRPATTRGLPSLNRPALGISACVGESGTAWNRGKAAARAWLRSEQRAGSRVARPVPLLSLCGTVLAIGQAWCIAFLLAGIVDCGACRHRERCVARDPLQDGMRIEQ